MEKKTHYLKELLDYLNLNANKFSTSIGNRQSASIYGILSFRLKMNDNMADKILEKYPRVNRQWLLTGEGKMLNATHRKSAEENVISLPVEKKTCPPNAIPYEFVKSLMDERVRADKLQDELIRLHVLLIERQLELFSKIADSQKEILDVIKQECKQVEKINPDAELSLTPGESR